MSRARKTAALDDFVGGLVASGAFSGLTAALGDGKRILWSKSAGQERKRPRQAAGWSTRWDVASLTKLHVASLAVILEQERSLSLRTRVGEVFPHAAPAMARLSLDRLLRHRSGLVAWLPLYARTAGRPEALELLLSGTLRGDSRRVLYSDLGYILWGFCAEAVLGESVEELLRRHLWRPLEMRGCSGPPGPITGVADCGLDNGRERLFAEAMGIRSIRESRSRRGVAQDGNARFLGGVPGHAGVFASAADLMQLAAEWLRPRRVLSPSGVRGALAGDGEYALGWARRRVQGTAGPALGGRAFGLVGSTGGSLWIDPERSLVCLLLGHRSSWADLRPTRRRFHRLAVEALG